MNTSITKTLIVISAGLALSCATPAAPQSMMNVQNDLSSSEAQALQAQFPRLMNDSRAALDRARDALESGDQAEVELYASIANSKYQSARNLSQSVEVGNRQRALEDALDSLEDEADFLANEAQELQRFNALKNRFDAATDSLDRYEGLEGEARQSLALARRKQGEALRSGASQLAPRPYSQGVTLTESALSALERGDFEATNSLSQRAVDAFENAATKSEDSALAERRRQEELQKEREQLEDTRSKAQKAIDNAADMKAAALAKGLERSKPDRFREADFLLDRAQVALDDQRFEQASQSAEKSASAFKSALEKDKQEPATALNVRAVSEPEFASRRPSKRLTQSPSAPTSRRDDALRFITKAQMLRAEALGRGDHKRCPNAFSEFEAVLQIATQRLESGDEAYALEHAIRAQERLRLCVRNRQPSSLSANAGRSIESAPEPSEDAQGSTSQQDSTNQNDRSEEPAAEAPSDISQAARKQAITSMNRADLELARAELQDVSSRDLARASSLRDTSQKWFEAEDYARATLFADMVLERLKPDTPDEKDASTDDRQKESAEQTTPEDSDQKTESQTRSDKDRTDQVEAAKTDAEKGRSAQASEVRCPENRALATYLKEAYTTRSHQESPGDPVELPMSLQAAISLDEEGACERAQEFYQRAANELSTASPKSKSARRQESGSSEKSADSEPGASRGQTDEKTTKAKASETEETQTQDTGDERVKERAMNSLAEAQRQLASLSARSDAPAFKLSQRLISKAQNSYQSKEYADAYMASEKAKGALQSLSTEDTSTSGSASAGAQWKSGYQTILDALIARDRVEPHVDTSSRAGFERGVSYLSKSRRSWSSKDYQAAQRFASAALEEFEEVKRMKADSIEEAERSEAAAAQKAALQKKQTQQEASSKRKSEANSALRKAEVNLRLCKDKNCRLRSPRDFIAGTEKLADAQDAKSSEDFTRATELAEQAARHFEDALAAKIELSPAKSQHLKVSSSRIELSPRITFELGSKTISSDSMESVRDLAAYLVENSDVLEMVSIVGFTDSKGSASNNKQLSKQRAQSVTDSLQSLGVGGSMLTTTGRGEADPIASNDTAEGRAKNRRVEIRYTLKGN